MQSYCHALAKSVLEAATFPCYEVQSDELQQLLPLWNLRQHALAPGPQGYPGQCMTRN